MPSESDFPSDLRALEDEYELIRELGQGGMAAVYLARKRLSGRVVAIKAVRARYLDDPDALRRFAREARTVADLEHPNIVRTETIEQLGDRAIAIIMEHVPGGTVRDRLREFGAFAAEHAESVLRDVASALAYAHRRGIVHRDVKPENIFLDPDRGRALLSDFGIARTMDGDSGITILGSALGTPQYMSPEQIDAGMVDGRSDIYSLGVLGWELLTGRRPWGGESLYGVIYKQKHEDLPRITSLRPRVPANLLFAIEGALQKDPAKRWQSADEFIERLTYNPPPVLAQDYPAGSAHPDNLPTVVFRRSDSAGDATAVGKAAPLVTTASRSYETASPAGVSTHGTVGSVPVPAGAAEDRGFARSEYTLPAYGPNADAAFEVDPPRARVLRAVGLFAPLAIAAVTLFVVLGGNRTAAPRGGTMTASGGTVAIDSARTRGDTYISTGLVRSATTSDADSTLASNADSASGDETLFDDDTVLAPEPPAARSMRLPPRIRAGSSGSARSKTSTEVAAAARPPGAFAADAKAAGVGVGRDTPTSDSGRSEREIEDPFRPPTVPLPPGGSDASSGGRAVKPPAGSLPSPRCRLASTADQEICLKGYVALGDSRMNRTLDALVAELRRIAGTGVGEPDPPTVQRVRVEHRAWVAIRDDECRRPPTTEEAPFWAAAHAECYTEMAQVRADELQDAVRRLRRR